MTPPPPQYTWADMEEAIRNNPAYERLLDKCLDLHEIWSDPGQPGGYKLGHHHPINGEIMLYNVENTPANLDNLKRELDSTGVAYTLTTVSHYKDGCNVLLTNIGK